MTIQRIMLTGKRVIHKRLHTKLFHLYRLLEITKFSQIEMADWFVLARREWDRNKMSVDIER